jgi:DNA-binding protein HU-beta
MKKAELIEALEGKTGESKASVNRVLDALPDVVFDGIKSHGSVTLPGLAKIEARTRAARTVRNPSTGASMDKPASVAPNFKPVKSFKDQVGGMKPQT